MKSSHLPSPSSTSVASTWSISGPAVFRHCRLSRSAFLLLISVFLPVMVPRAVGQLCYNYVVNEPAHFPRPWLCDQICVGGSRDKLPVAGAECLGGSGCPGGVGMNVLYDGSNPAVLSNQKVIDEHRNWHCEHGPGGTTGAGSGKRFVAFHKQYILDYDLWRQFPDRRHWGGTGPGQVNVGVWPVILAWDVNNVTDPSSSAYNPMPYGHPDCLHGSNRAANTACPGCQALTSQFRVPAVGGTLDSYTSADQLGRDLGTWHLTAYHCPVALTGCQDVGPSSTTPRDPMFWRAHKLLDDVHSTWQKLQPSDVVIVLDRSGSMGGSHPGGGTKLQAAKDAIRTFVALFPGGSAHFVGLVSYASTASDATMNMDLMPASGVLGDVTNPNDGALDMKLNNIVANGATSMGAGIREALSMLEDRRALGLANERQAILLLTDGMENTPPCLGGNFCSGAMVSPDEFLVLNSSGIHVGDIQLCVVGFGAEGTLDSALLSKLAEREGGIYVAGDVDEVGLKKFFVTCFSSLNSGILADDPVGFLPPELSVTDPVIYSACPGDSELTFVFSWHDRREPLRLFITAPSGKIVDLGDPAVESVVGPDFHIVRISFPYDGESVGDWTAVGRRLDQQGLPQRYFISSLVVGPARVEPIAAAFRPRTGEPLVPMFRIKQPYWPEDGYERVEASVFVTRPLEGVGRFLVERGLGDEAFVGGDVIDRRTATLMFSGTRLPGRTEVFPLFDDGTNGDLHANDHYWSVQLPDELVANEGTYHFRAVFKLSKDGCTTRREAEHTAYVDVGVDPDASIVQPEPSRPLPEGGLLTPVRIIPFDLRQNPLGPGLAGRPSCGPSNECRLNVEVPVVDHGDGSYTVNIETVRDVAGVRLRAFDTFFNIPIPCQECPKLQSIDVSEDPVLEDTTVIGTLKLTFPAPKAGVDGALVQLESSFPQLVSMPNSVVVPAGASDLEFPITVGHDHAGPGQPRTVVLSATYGSATVAVDLTVLPKPGEFRISVARLNGTIQLFWQVAGAELESASDPSGPWMLEEGATSPTEVKPLENSRRFYRLKR